MSGVVWHDIECGRYTQDLPLWQELAGRYVAPGQEILDVGAGTGRVSLALASAGHAVVALDLDQELLNELARRGAGQDLSVTVVCADARDFTIPDRRFALIVVPMQTLQLLDGREGRLAFFRRARAHMQEGAVLAVAIAAEQDFEEFEWREGDLAPLPDIAQSGGATYFSQPTAVRRVGLGFVLERRRERVDEAGDRSVSEDSVVLDIVDLPGLLATGAQAGLRPITVMEVPPTEEHIGSQVVLLAAS